jgi:MFS transporter, CP family, cyanate transporter
MSTRGAQNPLVKTQQGPCVIRQARAWTLATVFGVETGCYTLLLAWLAPFYLQKGWSSQEAGALLAGLTLCEVIAGLAVSFYASRWPDRRFRMIVYAAMGVAGFVCLFAAPLTLAWLAIALLGFGVGALFPLTLILTMDHSSNSHRAGVLTAFVQDVGYMIAAAMPSLAGAMRDRLGSFDMAWLTIVVILALSTLLIMRF